MIKYHVLCFKLLNGGGILQLPAHKHAHIESYVMHFPIYMSKYISNIICISHICRSLQKTRPITAVFSTHSLARTFNSILPRLMAAFACKTGWAQNASNTHACYKQPLGHVSKLPSIRQCAQTTRYAKCVNVVLRHDREKRSDVWHS